MTDTLTPVLTAHWDQPDIFTLDGYRRTGGWQALPKALAMAPEDLVSALKDSGLRGRGGAGFPTGVKWSFLPPGGDKPHYLVINADESEPGACKDVPLMMADPQLLIEGAAITCFAIKAHHAFIYVRGEVLHVIRRLRHAVQEAYAAGYLARTSSAPGSTWTSSCMPVPAPTSAARRRRCSPRSRATAGCRGSSRRSRRGRPVRQPDRNQQRRVDRRVPSVVANGADWFSGLGTERSKGYGIFSLSGHVATPGQYEAPLGITCEELLDLGRRGSGLATG